MSKSKTKNFFVWIIMGLLFIGLMGFGATGLSGNIRTVGEVGDKPITTQTYYEELQTLIRIRSSQVGRAISFPEAEAAGLPERALASVIAVRALDNEVAELGLSVGDSMITDQVMSNPAFRGIDGAFDRATYREALARNGLSVRDFETGLREDAARALLQGAVFTGIPDPTAYGDTLATFAREGRSFTWATIGSDNVEIILPEPPEADLQAHYDANPELYTSLETRVIDYAWLTPSMIQDDVPVSEDELRAEYDARIEEYIQPERRLVERLVFGDEAAAQSALDAITAGETTFPELVLERGLTLDDVDIGDVTEDGMGDAGPAIFALENGETTGPYPTDLGFALFRMNAVLAARNVTFEQALPDLREDQAAARALRIIEDQIDPLNDLLAGGAAIADLAEQTDMTAGSIVWTVETQTDIAAYAAFQDVALRQEPGAFIELWELDDGGLFAIDVTEIRAPELIPFDDIRDEVIAGWEAQETAALIAADAEAKRTELEAADVDFPDLDIDATTETSIQRRGFINGTPPNFMSTVFEMNVGDVLVIPYDGASLIVRLDGVTAAADDDAFTAERDAMAESAAEGIAQDIYELFSRTVQLRTDLYVNDNALNAVHTNFR